MYGRALAQTVRDRGDARANADVLPFGFNNLDRDGEDVREGAAGTPRRTRAKEIGARNRAITAGYYAAASDPREPTMAPPSQVPPPEFNFAPLLNALDSLNRASMRYESAFQKWSKSTDSSTADFKALNEKLIQSERVLTSGDGLPRRPWFQHMLYAPGYYTGYGVKTMPGAREAIEQGEWADVETQIARIASALRSEASVVNSAAALLEGRK